MARIFPIVVKRAAAIASDASASWLGRINRGVQLAPTVTGTPAKPQINRGVALTLAGLRSALGSLSQGPALTPLVSGSTQVSLGRGMQVQSRLSASDAARLGRGVELVQTKIDLVGSYSAATATNTTVTGAAWANPANAQGNPNGTLASHAGSATSAQDAFLTFTPTVPTGKETLSVSKVEVLFHVSQTGTTLANGNLRLSTGTSANPAAALRSTSTGNIDNIATPLVYDITSNVLAAAGSVVTTPDSGPNGYTGTRLGAITPTVAASPFGAEFGNAHTFEGVDRNNASMGWLCDGVPAQTGPHTLECRYRTGATFPTAQVIAARWGGTDATDSNTLLYLSGDSDTPVRKFVASVFHTDGTFTSAISTTVVAANTNYVVAGTYDGTSVRIFVNGVLEGTVATGGKAIAAGTNGRFAIGREYTTGAIPGAVPWPYPINGTIDEVRLSNVARYTATYTPTTAPFISDANTVGLWQLDGTGTSGGDAAVWTAIKDVRARVQHAAALGQTHTGNVDAVVLRVTASRTDLL